MKKWMNSLIAGLLVIGIASPAWAASSSGKPSVGTSGNSSHHAPATSGVSSPSSNNVNRSGAQRPTSSETNPQTGSNDLTGKTYNSGPQRPSSSVTQQPSSTTTSQPTQVQSNAPTSKSKFGGVGSFIGGMAVGGLLGSMFHPFGGGMNTMGSTGGFSFMGILMDILIIAAIVWVVRKFWRRRA
jgi:hypothetical protein